MRRKKGPLKTEDWENALSGALSGEKVEYLKRGKLKKTDYKYLLKLIENCVVENLNNSLALFKEGTEDLIEGLYRLERLTDTVYNVYFFKELDFIRKADKENLSQCVINAVSDFLSRIEERVDFENADLNYHISALKRAAGISNLVKQ